MSTEQRFDPAHYLTKIKGNDYLEVKWRLAWLRSEHPDAAIDTECLRYDAQEAAFKATVSIPGGGSASGHGSETPGDFGDYYEKAECLPLSAQILTRNGFTSVYDLQVGQDVAAYDLDEDRVVWTPLLESKVYVNQPIKRLANRRDFDVTLTSGHSWVVDDRNGKRRLLEAEKITSNQRLIIAAEAESGDSPITPEEAAILGWLFTDGTIKRKGKSLSATITQSKLASVAAIRDLVPFATESVGQTTIRTFPSGRSYACLPQHTFRLPTAIVRALFEKAAITDSTDLPALATRLRSEARRAMFDAMMAADGDKRGYFGKKRKQGVQECWQILATLLGIAVGPRRNEERFTVQRAKRRRVVSGSELTLSDAGRATVWCPTTAYGTWITRLADGRVLITGNTKALGRALAALGFGTQFSEDFAFDPTGERVVDTPVQRPSAPRQQQPIQQQRPAQQQRPPQQGQGGGSNTNSQTITDRQRNFLFAIVKEAGFVDTAEDALNIMAQEQFNCASVNELTRQQASAAIEFARTQDFVNLVNSKLAEATEAPF